MIKINKSIDMVGYFYCFMKFVILGLLFSISALRAAPAPFEAGSKWVICQGYNTKEIDHVNEGNPSGKNVGLYALDLVIDLGGQIPGSFGCPTVKETAGKKIVSPAVGKVIINTSHKVCLQLDQPHGLIKSIEFYHVLPAAGLKSGAQVVVGQDLGFLEKIAVPHLHLAAFKTNDCELSANTTPFNDFFDGIDLGQLFKKNVLDTHQHWGKKLSAALVPISNLSATGSVVDPSSCTLMGPGCSYDVVRMQPAVVSSSATFQIFSQSALCQVVEISQRQPITLPGLFVSVKRFDEDYPGARGNALSTIYKATSLPVRIPLPPNQFMVLMVTSFDPLPNGKSVDVTATCVKGGFQQNSPGNQLVNIYKPNLDNQKMTMMNWLDDGAAWGGAGSLIGYSGNTSSNAARNGFTKDKDDVVSVFSRKSKSMFQAWRSSSTCHKVKFEDSAGKSGSLVDVSYKLWDSANWVNLNSQVLPFSIDLAANGFWNFQVTVKDPSAVRRMLVQCLN